MWIIENRCESSKKLNNHLPKIDESNFRYEFSEMFANNREYLPIVDEIFHIIMEKGCRNRR